MFTVCLTAGIVRGEDRSLPQPRVVTPGVTDSAPPSDAVVLFNGHDTSEWTREDGSPIKWALQSGTLLVRTGTGDAYTKRKLSSAQIHIEFDVPYMPAQHDQARGNSGIFLQGRYEIQILDSYQNPTYADGSCGALYNEYAPLVNACRKPEHWQTYDIIFHAPKCSPDSKVLTPGDVTVLQNGVLVQDHVRIKGPTDEALDQHVCDAGPLRLQDHVYPPGTITPMRFRNIWYRPLAE